MNALALIGMALSSLAHHKMRSLLTILGVVFGVGAVITMLSVGEGARSQMLAEIGRMGLGNVVIESRPLPVGQGNSRQQWWQPAAYGLNDEDSSLLAAHLGDEALLVGVRDLPINLWSQGSA
ncbi:MAG: ABC transporter permease, partial [Planctomycetota bacterium]